MRDNLILAGESLDEAQFCLDLKGCGSNRIIWRGSCDATGWEVTDSFARAWGWVIWNCEGRFQSMNHW
jgi:hypothetical protein